LIVPEFPIRHSSNFQTVNADYLLLRRDEPSWLLVELKTDRASVGEDQAKNYVRAAKGPASKVSAMRKLLEDLPQVRKHAKGRLLKQKYTSLIERFTGLERFVDAPVKVVYISPSRPIPAPDIFVSLAELSAWKATGHEQLWRFVQPLLARLASAGSP
jgi:hypothetical protein